jgi:uncharacterized protein (TIGR03437 family)
LSTIRNRRGVNLVFVHVGQVRFVVLVTGIVTAASAQTGLTLSESRLEFIAFGSGDSPSPQFFTATAPRPALLSIRAEGGEWLRVRPTRVATPARIQVSIDSARLPAGYYSGRIAISAAGIPDQFVGVNLNVEAQSPNLETTPDVVRLTVSSDNIDVVQEAIFVRNAGGGGPIPFRASVVDPIPGFSLILQSSETAPNTQVPVRVQVDPSGLANGVHRALVRIESAAGTREIPVSVVAVAGGPVLGLNLTGLRFEARQGEGHSNTRNILVLNSGTGSLDWQAEVLTGNEWLSVDSAAARGTATLRNAGRLAIDANPGSLAPGDYYGLIRISATGALNSPQYFTGVLRIRPAADPPSPDPSPQGLFFVGDAGMPPPPTQPIRLFVSSTDPTPFQASVSTVDEGDWLTAEPASGVTSTQNTQVLTVRADARNLGPGIYTGEVTVAFSNNEIRTTNITLVVPPRIVSQTAKGARFLEGCSPTALSLTQTGSVNSFGAAVGWPLPLIVRLADDCGDPVLGAQMIAMFSNGDPVLPMKLTNPQVGLYSTTWVPGRPGSQVRVTARATAPNLGTASADIIGKVEPNRPPVLLKNATLSNLNPVAGAPLAQGAVAQIFGTDLAPAAASAPSVPLPANLNGVTVLMGGYEAPIFFVSPGQINVQVPFELDVNQEHSMVVAGNGGITIPDSISLTSVRPGLYSIDGRAVALHPDGTFVTANSPARPDEEITLHLEAMGRTDPAVGSGSPSPPDPPAEPLIRPTVVLNDQESPVVWARLAAGWVGLYQIRFKVPSNAAEGDLPVWVKQADAVSNIALLPVRR